MKYNFNITKVVLDTKYGENNGRDFFYHEEKQVKIDSNSKHCTFGILTVPMADPYDYDAKRYECCVMGSEAFLKLPKLPWSLLNTNALYAGENVFNSTDHSALSTRLKNQAGGTKPNEAALVDIIQIETRMDISNAWGNEIVKRQGRNRPLLTVFPPKDPKFVDYIDQPAHKLKGNFKTVYTYMVPGDATSDLIPVSAVLFRFVLTDTIKDLWPDIEDVTDTMADLELAQRNKKFIEDDDGL